VKKSALVFAGGSFLVETLQWVSEEAKQADVWCADRGVEHAISCGLWPKVIVGDCDSVSPKALQDAIAHGAEIIKHPQDKNASDLELTLKELTDSQYSDITLLAVSGGRTDHALFNWMLIMQQDWPYQLSVVDETISAYLVHSDVSFSAQLSPGTTVSLLSRESVAGVTTKGMKYPLTDARLMGGSTLGLSNEVANEKAGIDDNFAKLSAPTEVQVQVTTGRLLVCVVHNDSLAI